MKVSKERIMRQKILNTALKSGIFSEEYSNVVDLSQRGSRQILL